MSTAGSAALRTSRRLALRLAAAVPGCKEAHLITSHSPAASSRELFSTWPCSMKHSTSRMQCSTSSGRQPCSSNGRQRAG